MVNRHFCNKHQRYYSSYCPDCTEGNHSNDGIMANEEKQIERFDKLIGDITNDDFFKTPHTHIFEKYNNDYYSCKICGELIPKKG